MHGPHFLDDTRVLFRVWAPFQDQVKLVFDGENRPRPMTPICDGFHELICDDVVPGALYYFQVGDHQRFPDPASRYQPQGVHGPSQLTKLDPYPWQTKNWRGLKLEELVLYECHLGCFTQTGTLREAAEQLPYLKKLGINTIALMPIAGFPGRRNWGYDGVLLYAVPECYGTPRDLQAFVDLAHQQGVAVFLDVVYNHLGPEGNYFDHFGPYFSKRTTTPWGKALNFDGRDCDPVRAYFLENARYWLTEYRIDGLRLDAIDDIRDFSVTHLLEELSEMVEDVARESGRSIILIGEASTNNPRWVTPRSRGGIGLHALWDDDLHHAMHAHATGERTGYYADFGTTAQLVETLQEGILAPNGYREYRRRRHGKSFAHLADKHQIVFLQNHDQTGNRPDGKRFHHLVGIDRTIQYAALYLISPFVPMLFMGEEYAAEQPFYFFIDYGDAPLIDATRKGRKREFKTFGWKGKGTDPQDLKTFAASRLNLEDHQQGVGARVFSAYQTLLAQREIMRKVGLLKKPSKVSHDETHNLITRRFQNEKARWVLIVHQGEQAVACADLGLTEGHAAFYWADEQNHTESQETLAPGSTLLWRGSAE
ncbi:malto-oligosyltrehalose trehalohydrolase [Acanthopleuribacter pedis]|uniref:Malto-oligosyltrehalose trehalohydrolase n=1 Tax=Acanthopleuribacter pedis TaxID=442870 RepID=A0A8J7QJK9_9BACT|nr:malto-oligosyltrehalose trehalohydrolase [Acanthopleuribacter pedis]MBO1322061.1 malto-oligosyltrehalose trehalohydrolase [Acanthopleuribacter pedis]